MQFYNQSDLFWLLISAARHPALVPDPALLKKYADTRLARAIKALRSKNIFLYTEGTRTSVNLNDVTTIYTQPAGTRLLVVGYTDNLRYGVTQQSTVLGGPDVVFPQTHQIRVVGNEGVEFSDDFMMAQSGASGQPRFTSVFLPVPFILEANEQIAVTLGYDTAMSAPAQIPDQAFIFFAVKVKDRLTSDDMDAIEEIKTYIANHNYQRGVFLNCVSPNTEDIEFDAAGVGGLAECQTRPASGPLLITGIGTTLLASTILITDTANGHSFSLNQPMQSSALNMFDNADPTQPAGNPEGAAIWEHYQQLAIPHLLRPGAALHATIVNGVGIQAATGTAGTDTQTGNILIFQGLTV